MARSTIVALSSGGLPSGVAVIRLSGPEAISALAGLCKKLPKPREFALRKLYGSDGLLLDHCLVTYFLGPNSFTGEDCVEIHAHGSRAVVSALLRYLSDLPNIVLAEAGDFTRRAFEAGKLDLTAVEGLGDLIEAETEGQRRLALSRASGALKDVVNVWRSDITDLRAEVEAQLDFSDEGDVPEDLPQNFWQDVDALREKLASAAKTLNSGHIVREGFRVVLAGPPNVGKSSLINALTKSDVAIVTNEAGTTRDVREVPLDIGGQLILLYDIAGLRDAISLAEIEGVKRALDAIDQADLVLWLTAPDVDDETIRLNDETPIIRVGSKSDLGVSSDVELNISARNVDDVQRLLDTISGEANRAIGSSELLVSHKRDQEALVAAMKWLSACEEVDLPLELVAENLRGASDALGRLLGIVDAEAVLDSLFSGFCIGK